MGDYGRPEPPSQTELKTARWDMARVSQKAKVLMLRGNAESGESFESKTRFFKNILQNACPSFPGGVELFYPTAPHRIQPAGSITREEGDFDAWTWGFVDYMTEVMQGYGETIRYMLEVIRTTGSFIGIVGFSAGAATAHTLVSLAERRASPELIQSFQIDSSLLPPPFHFAICSSGFILSHPQYKSLYYPRIQTPVLHFVGNFDPIIPEDHTLKLAGRCKNRLIVYHPGAHFVPRGKIFQEAILDFIKEWLRRDATGCPSVLPVASASYEVILAEIALQSGGYLGSNTYETQRLGSFILFDPLGYYSWELDAALKCNYDKSRELNMALD